MQFRLVLFLFLAFSFNNVFAQLEKKWATYLGSQTQITEVLYDSLGYVYVAGRSSDTSLNIASPNAFKDNMINQYTLYSNQSSFLVKFDTLGNRVWGTYIGNEGTSEETKIAFDQNNNIVVTGYTKGVQNLIGTPNTFSSDVPIVNMGNNYPYIIKFDSDGNRLWGSYFTNNNDPLDPIEIRIKAVAVDKDNDIIIAGSIRALTSFSFSSNNTFMPSWPYQDNMFTGFVIKMDSEGSGIIWGTYLGGDKTDVINHINCDSLGNIYLVGTTTSTSNIATSNAQFPSFFGSVYDRESFITKLNPQGQRLWGTYTNGIHAYGGMIINSEGDFYLAGLAIRDIGISTPNVHQEEYKGNTDYVLTKWSSDGEMLWGTYYGGAARERYSNLLFTNPEHANEQAPLAAMAVNYQSLALDDEENIILVGGTSSESHIKKGCLYNLKDEEYPLGILAKFYPTGKLKWGTYIDVPLNAIAYVPESKDFYLVSATNKDDLATSGAFQTITNNSGYLLKMQGDFICPELDISIAYENDSLILAEDFDKYEWYKNDTLLTDSNNWLIPDETGGYYHAILKDSCNCVYSTDTIWVEPISIKEQRVHNINVKLYPNPNKGSFYIKGSIKNPPTQNISFSIQDIVGKTLYEGEIPVDDNNFYHEIDIKDLNPGVYLLYIKNEDEEHYLKWVKE